MKTLLISAVLLSLSKHPQNTSTSSVWQCAIY